MAAAAPRLTERTTTRDANRYLCEKPVLPYLAARKLHDLTAAEVDEWLPILAASLSTQGVRACLNHTTLRGSTSSSDGYRWSGC